MLRRCALGTFPYVYRQSLMNYRRANACIPGENNDLSRCDIPGNDQPLYGGWRCHEGFATDDTLSLFSDRQRRF